MANPLGCVPHRLPGARLRSCELSLDVVRKLGDVTHPENKTGHEAAHTTGNKEDEEDARELIMEACTRIDWNMDENCDGNSCAIVTVGDIFLVMVACATPVEWAHLPFFPSYDLGLPGSPFLISGLLSTVVYAYLFKREADEGAAGSLVARDRSKEINEDEKQKENEKTEDKYGKQPAEDREDLDDPDGAGEL